MHLVTPPAPVRLALLAPLALFLATCASPRPPPATARPLHPALPRSSIAAVLAQGQDLGLDEAQVRGLRRIDDDLARKQESTLREAATAHPPKAASQGEGALERRGGGHRAGGSERPEAKASPADRDAVWDDNDTAAFREAEGLLRPDQVERARQIAERFRERRYDLRAARAGTGSP